MANKDSQLKAKKATAPAVTHRCRLLLPDGSVVCNRKVEEWVLRDKDFIPITLDIDAREHGVRLLSWEIKGNDIVAQVEWL